MLDVGCQVSTTTCGTCTHCSTFFIAKNQVCGTSRNGFFLCFHTYNIFTCISKTLDSIKESCKLQVTAELTSHFLEG